jgi:hypothetical protein
LGTPGVYGTVLFFILPYIEQQALYTTDQWARGYLGSYYGANSSNGTNWADGWTTWAGGSQPVSTYLAPNDPSATPSGLGSWGNMALSSYVGNLQAVGGLSWGAPPNYGYMNWYAGWGVGGYQGGGVSDTNGPSASIPKSFRDGTSNTIVFLEKYSLCGDGSIVNGGGSSHAVETLWSYSYYHSIGTGYYPQGPFYCPLGGETGVPAQQIQGGSPPGGMLGGPTLRDLPQFLPTDHLCDPQRVQAYSSGVIQVSLGDGSVRGVTPNITLPTWYRALNPKDGLVLGPDW